MIRERARTLDLDPMLPENYGQIAEWLRIKCRAGRLANFPVRLLAMLEYEPVFMANIEKRRPYFNHWTIRDFFVQKEWSKRILLNVFGDASPLSIGLRLSSFIGDKEDYKNRLISGVLERIL